ncbi:MULTISPECIES: hypothetical protein [Bacillus cereus group]|uniref:hypothetical protein n=1 Tax=Bacillus cereus group TaxID=86661 RepID=UPI0007F05A28|nr:MULTISPECIES: hypothetical protein [Bacillus cereus group]ANN31171.1 hypothetical protein A9498_05580 [Bacillus thuringiensis serovar coreanensis]MDZ4488786.1 hypothetical protein [Bacillus cereus]NSL59048.1 hypothetical protein [Bacillus cereus]OPD51501.1 hypothetical protein BVG00_06225 [Bacillus cereus]PEV49887.1 hypothetical protein CN421_05485 [Bacillus thuringiensis]
MEENQAISNEVMNGVLEVDMKRMKTLSHSLNVLTQNEILEELEAFNISVNLEKITKKAELIQYIEYMFQKGNIKDEIFHAVRARAFNLNLDATDGYFLSFSDEWKFSETILIRAMTEWNEKNLESVINLEYLDKESQQVKVEISRLKEKYIFDQKSMYSTSYFEEDKALVDVYFKEKIVYFQTTNVKIFHSIKTVLRQFLICLFETDKLKLLPPKMQQNLSITLSKDGAFAFDDRAVNPTTIKLMDLLLELDNPQTNFSGFECTEITFDHEDTEKKDMKSRIDAQSYGGGNLLGKDDVKKLILSNRCIINVEVKIEYDERISAEEVIKHTIIGGLRTNKLNGLRLYIKNSEYSLKRVLEKAYSDLKNVFVQLYSQNSLRNEEKIKLILGLETDGKTSE